MASQGQALSHNVQMQENQLIARSIEQQNQHQHELRMQREYLRGMGAMNGDPNNGQQMPFPLNYLQGTKNWADDLGRSGITLYDPRSLWGGAPSQRQ